MIWKIFYNFIILPILFIIGLIFSIFNKKIRLGLLGRFQSYKNIKKFINNVGPNKDIYWFHVASLGEYEQTKPVISGLKEVEPNSLFILSFFSPSGYSNVMDDIIDCKIFLPIDFYWIVKKCLKLANPKKLILTAYDIWPNLIWSANSLNIHTTIFAARFSENTYKLTIFIRSFYKYVYNHFSAIYTISQKDHRQIKKILFPSEKPILRALGNPRYDQVKQKSDSFTKERTKSVLLRPKQLLVGSSHHEDEERILDSIIDLMKDKKDFSIIWASHEPNKEEINKIRSVFDSFSFSSEFLGSKNPDEINSRVIIVDSVGRLSQLYWYAQMAYIGGGFSTGVHNVMEPAIARLPIFFGPKYDNSPEAEKLINVSGGFVINNGKELKNGIEKILNDKNAFMKASYSSTSVIHNNLGSATRVVRNIIHD
tara:strand:- start:2035 stop:3309 length:1275 start_codon:yes stop_codon:yes gene_type:complete